MNRPGMLAVIGLFLMLCGCLALFLFIGNSTEGSPIVENFLVKSFDVLLAGIVIVVGLLSLLSLLRQSLGDTSTNFFKFAFTLAVFFINLWLFFNVKWSTTAGFYFQFDGSICYVRDFVCHQIPLP